MKKHTYLGLLLLLVLSLTACGNQVNETDMPPASDTKEPAVLEPAPELEPEPEPPIPFTDVPEDASYYDTVVWAYEKGIVSDGSTFEPNSTCTRAQVIMFLWRTTGSPEPQIAEAPFSDVSSSNWYYKPALWAYENHIITGTTFNPDNPCTNAEALTFLWRAEGKPMAAVYSSPIALTDSDSYYARPVAWAENNGMFAGMDSAFDPAAPCSRSDIVTYLRWATEQWMFTEEEKTVQAEYEQIVYSTQPTEILGSGMLYADYIDVDGDNNVELLTLVRDFSEGEFTATIYSNVQGHAGKSCEKTFDEMFGGRNAHFFLCKVGSHLYFQYYGVGIAGDSYQFYKIEKGAITLENDLEGHDIEYIEENTVKYNGHTDFGKEITEDEFDAILQKHTDKKTIFSRSYSDVNVLDRGIVPSREEYDAAMSRYWKDYWAASDPIYAAVLEGDFSAFAGDYEGGCYDPVGAYEGEESAVIDKDGTPTGGHHMGNAKPLSITVRESGEIYVLTEYIEAVDYEMGYTIYPPGCATDLPVRDELSKVRISHWIGSDGSFAFLTPAS